MVNLKKIILFANYNINGISTRYRGVYVLNELSKKHNIETTFVYPGYSVAEIINFLIACISVLFSDAKHTRVIYQKIHTRGVYTSVLKMLIKLKPKGSIYDTDDADYLRYDDRNIIYFIQHCEMCIVGSSALEAYAKQYNHHVAHITSPIIAHAQKKIKRNKILHIGWIGDYGENKGYTPVFSHKVSLNTLLFPILLHLDFQFTLTLLGIKNPNDKLEIEAYFKNNPNITLDIPLDVSWLDEDSIYKRIESFDIGVSPLVSHAFNASKSAFKVKQYLSCGVPVLASPVGENTRFVRNEYNGYLCENTNDFMERIRHIHAMSDTEYNTLRLNSLVPISPFSMEYFCEHWLQKIC